MLGVNTAASGKAQQQCQTQLRRLKLMPLHLHRFTFPKEDALTSTWEGLYSHLRWISLCLCVCICIYMYVCICVRLYIYMHCPFSIVKVAYTVYSSYGHALLPLTIGIWSSKTNWHWVHFMCLSNFNHHLLTVASARCSVIKNSKQIVSLVL